jgi:hypothetical protein
MGPGTDGRLAAPKAPCPSLTLPGEAGMLASN